MTAPSGPAGPTARAQGCAVLLVEPCRLLAEALAAQLTGRGWVLDVTTATSAAGAVEESLRRHPGLVLVHASQARLCLPHLHAAGPVVAYDVGESQEEIIAVAELGVAGLLPRGADLAELETVAAGVLEGRAALPSAVATALLRHVSALARERSACGGDVAGGHLTPRERQILVLIERGWTNRQIAEHLVIEVRTVKNHVHNLLEKLRVRRRGEAAAHLRSALLAPEAPMPAALVPRAPGD